jgi:hypothetical protein
VSGLPAVGPAARFDGLRIGRAPAAPVGWSQQLRYGTTLHPYAHLPSDGFGARLTTEPEARSRAIARRDCAGRTTRRPTATPALMPPDSRLATPALGGGGVLTALEESCVRQDPLSSELNGLDQFLLQRRFDGLKECQAVLHAIRIAKHA